MKHTIRMLMIPEDLYNALMLQSSSAIVPAEKGAIDRATHIVNSTTPIVHTAERMNAVTSGDVGRMMNDAERLIHYQQEFKRYQKLLEDEREKPVNVHVKNLPAAAEQLRNAIAGIKPALSQQAKKHTPFTPSTKKRKIFEDEEEEEEENEAEKTEIEQKPESSMPFANIEIAKRHISKVLDYLKRNPENVGLGGEDDNEICRLMKGKYRPVKDSNITDILNYYFIGKYQTGVKKPTGFQTFMNNAKSDFTLQQLLSQQSSSGTGHKKIECVVNTIQHLKKVKKAIPKNKEQFRFKPKLW